MQGNYSGRTAQRKTEEPLQYYAKLLNVYAVHRFEDQLFTIKRWKGLKLPYAHGLQRSRSAPAQLGI